MITWILSGEAGVKLTELYNAVRTVQCLLAGQSVCSMRGVMMSVLSGEAGVKLTELYNAVWLGL